MTTGYTKTFKRVDYSVFSTACEQLGMSQGDLAEACGYAGNSAAGWKKEGKIPEVVGLAVECLIRRQAKGEPKMFILTAPHNKVSAIRDVVIALGGSLTEIAR